ncbi:hypothetical protein CsSME_00012722 [Camellia sinensis var. sinensis]
MASSRNPPTRCLSPLRYFGFNRETAIGTTTTATVISLLRTPMGALRFLI